MPAPLPIKPSPAIRMIKTEQEEEEDLLDQELNRFWQMEEITSKDTEAIYKEVTSRDPSGRYVISLPKKEPAPLLGESRPVAIRRFVWNERSLEKKDNSQNIRQHSTNISR